MADKNIPKPVGGGVLGYFDTRYNDKRYRVAYSTDIANNTFLKPIKVQNITDNVPVPTNTQEYKDLSDPNKNLTWNSDFQASVSRLKQIIEKTKPNLLPEMSQASAVAGTNKYYDPIKPATGTQGTPPPTDPNLTSFIPDPVTPPNQGLVLSKEIAEEIVASADATIQSLRPAGSDQPIIISYPIDASYSDTQDHVVIEQFTYRAPQQGLFTSGQNLNTGNFAQIITQGLTRNSNLRDFIGLVKLPIPNQLAISNGVSWGEDRANPVEAAAFFGALGLAQNALSGSVSDVFGGALSGFSQFIDEIKKGGFGAGAPAGLLLSSFISQYALGKIGINVDPAQFIARGTGTTINPNLELLFNGPKLRSFSFTFEFAPDGVNDAVAARRVIRFFKQGMASKRFKSSAIFIGSPNVFRISYRGDGGKSIKGLNRFKICALTSCEINYTPEGVYQSYSDPSAVSMPVRTNMALSFTELTPIFEQDYFEQEDPSIRDLFTSTISSISSQDPITYDDIGF
jgi:hypothetical protein